ncbi:MAG: hypothetical protein JWO98_145, partial [Frankiales bacterium]|nr:hypothetical protein [Frankiales bacterium]
TGPVLTELMAALPVIAADAQAFGDDPGPRTPPTTTGATE